MRRERFEELLSDKLQDLSVAPPEGLFDRISASLDEMPAVAPAPVAPRRLPMWRYASAAAAVLLAIGISWLAIDHTTEEQQSLLATTTPVERTISVAPPAKEAPAKEATTTTPITQQSEQITDRLRALFVEEAIAQEEQLAQLENLTEDLEPQSLLAAQHTEAEQSTNTLPKTVEGPELQDAPRSHKRLHSTDDASEPWRRMMAEQRAAERRNEGRVVASLYGGNNGSMGLGKLRSNGVASLLQTDMLVSETLDGVLLAQSSRAPQQAKLKHDVPISLGAGVSIPIGNRIAIETGLAYNYLHSSSSTEQTMSTYDKERHLHYVGIPVGISYTIINKPSFNLYSRSGITIEKGVSGRDVVVMDGKEVSSTDIEFKGIQPSVDLSIGAMFNVGNIGLYAEPGLAYYFETASQPASYRTENPVGFSFKMGLKYLFGN